MVTSYSFEQIKEKLEHEFSRSSRLPDGVRYLKIRTLIDREALKFSQILKKFLLDNGIQLGRINVEEIVRIRKSLFEKDISDDSLNDIIKQVYKELREVINYDKLKGSLQNVAENGDSYWNGWNSVYRDNIRDHVQHHFVRNPSIQSLNDLLQKIDQDLTSVVKGYAVISWYNQWTSAIIERIFMEHSRVIPTIRRIDKVDFFFLNIPFDLKVTFLPEQYSRQKKREFNITSDGDIIELVKKQPMDLAVWLYENQGEPRFSDSNRIFIVLIDESNLAESWKLKAAFDLINEKVNSYLNLKTSVPQIEWEFEGDRIRGRFKTFSDVILITRNTTARYRQVTLHGSS